MFVVGICYARLADWRHIDYPKLVDSPCDLTCLNLLSSDHISFMILVNDWSSFWLASKECWATPGPEEPIAKKPFVRDPGPLQRFSIAENSYSSDTWKLWLSRFYWISLWQKPIILSLCWICSSFFRRYFTAS